MTRASMTSAEVKAIEAVGAANAAAIAATLHDVDPQAVAASTQLGDGHLVLSGPTLYVNRAFGLGLSGPVDGNVFAALEEHSASVGVAPSLETVPETHTSVTSVAAARGYAVEDELDVLIVRLRQIADRDANAAIVVREVHGPDGLAEWQDIAAEGWGGREGAARRANDLYAAAAFAAGETLLVARAAADDRPLGCAVVVPRGQIATLGGMSTLPDERRRGVQREMVRVRLERARTEGCELAVTTAVSGGDSARNLRRFGFELAYRKQIWTRPSPTSA